MALILLPFIEISNNGVLSGMTWPLG